ncbi:hypothetical protein AX14_006719 [Amanita brunnescens Koide BX004]|nr:hypothetical protein AX14_006719 [Amanita brunnescens Koide BX004]
MEFQTADLLPSEFLRLYSISVFFRVEAAALQLSRAHLGFPFTAVFVIDYESPVCHGHALTMRPTLLLQKSGRSAWKGPYFVTFPNLREALTNHVPIKTQARSCTILPNFVGIRFLVHNGKDYAPVLVTQDMVGHKLGEFSHTKKRFNYK